MTSMRIFEERRKRVVFNRPTDYITLEKHDILWHKMPISSLSKNTIQRSI